MMLLLWVALLALAGSSQALYDPNCDGKQVMVHLFGKFTLKRLKCFRHYFVFLEWKWSDIALECERYLAPNEFCGVQVSPPMEHVKLPSNSPPNPWWIRYQPASYKLDSRSGTEAEFIDMVQRCNRVGVRHDIAFRS